MNEYDPTSPDETFPDRPVSSATSGPSAAGSSGARLVGLGDHGQGGTPAKGTAIAVEQKEPMDRGRCGDVCGCRTFRRSGDVPLGISRANCVHQPLHRRSPIRWSGIQRSVWTGRRGSIRHSRQRVQVGLHNDDISGSEGNRRRDVLHKIREEVELDLGERH